MIRMYCSVCSIDRILWLFSISCDSIRFRALCKAHFSTSINSIIQASNSSLVSVMYCQYVNIARIRSNVHRSFTWDECWIILRGILIAQCAHISELVSVSDLDTHDYIGLFQSHHIEMYIYMYWRAHKYLRRVQEFMAFCNELNSSSQLHIIFVLKW